MYLFKTIQKQSKSSKSRSLSYARHPLTQRIRVVVNFSLGPFEVVLGVDFRNLNSGELVLCIRVPRGLMLGEVISGRSRGESSGESSGESKFKTQWTNTWKTTRTRKSKTHIRN